ncbi:hypothetical protein BV898_14457 [Hypsibius exemplaris]|uniref:G-protein coupled receptors family 1 profile domain-containing protein n=1 Tax=Hypsibius exemplaris TaxID=2072580 RepID=A0A9X6RJC5_HYPEX|nr:hypothetical protein BV898_14457 [Hypsibius exemplaris]
MKTFKVCPPDGLWHGLAGDDGGNETYFTRNVQNITTLNRGCLSLDYYHPGSHLYWLDTIGYPILLAFCTLGNILSLIVFCCERPNTSKNFYFAAIAICNFTYMWSLLPFYLHNAIPWVRDTEAFRVFFWRSEGIWKFLIDTFVTTSDWILIMFSIERLCAVCAPHQYSQRSSRGVFKASLCIFGVFLGAVFYSLYNLIGYYWFYYHHHPETGLTDQLPAAIKIWRHMQQLAIVRDIPRASLYLSRKKKIDIT